MFTSTIIKLTTLVSQVKDKVNTKVQQVKEFIEDLKKDFNNWKEWRDFNPVYCNHSYDKFEINYNRFEINENEVNNWKSR